MLFRYVDMVQNRKKEQSKVIPTFTQYEKGGWDCFMC